MRILVTGGAGFIGSHFARLLARQEASGIESIVILDKLTYAGRKENLTDILIKENVEFIQGDICDTSIVAAAISKVDS